MAVQSERSEQKGLASMVDGEPSDPVPPEEPVTPPKETPDTPPVEYPAPPDEIPPKTPDDIPQLPGEVPVAPPPEVFSGHRDGLTS